MIIVQTNMKKIPDRCVKCKLCGIYYDGYNDFEGTRFCYINGKQIPYEYVKEKNNWMYIKPKWCPLKEVDSE